MWTVNRSGIWLRWMDGVRWGYSMPKTQHSRFNNILVCTFECLPSMPLSSPFCTISRPGAYHSTRPIIFISNYPKSFPLLFFLLLLCFKLGKLFAQAKSFWRRSRISNIFYAKSCCCFSNIWKKVVYDPSRLKRNDRMLAHINKRRDSDDSRMTIYSTKMYSILTDEDFIYQSLC